MNMYQLRDKEFRPSRSSGVALVTTMVILLILTIMGVSAVQSTSMQVRIARNVRDSGLAFQAAESALKDAEEYMEGLNSLLDFDAASNPEANGRYTAAACWPTACLVADNPGQSGYYVTIPVGADFKWKLLDWDGGTVRTGDTNIDGVSGQPKYIVEFVKTVVSEEDTLNLDNIGQDTGAGRTQMFRATAYGTGGTARSHVTLQSTYGKKF